MTSTQSPQILLSQNRGIRDHGWLLARHSFSFGDYFHPDRNHYRTLRVINEDTVAPGEGFETHGHRDMEIFTYMLSGALSHRDSMGNGAVLHKGDVQRMSAGSGIEHSEFNASDSEPAHLLQIWILPQSKGIAPSYEDRHFSDDQKKNRLLQMVGPAGDPTPGILHLHQDVKIFASLLEAGKKIQTPTRKDRHFWIQVATGQLKIENQILSAGDAWACTGLESLTLEGVSNPSGSPAEFLLFDLN